MHHLLLGIDPTPLGCGAVRPRHRPARRRSGRGHRAWPARRARLHVLPCIAGHVGADAAARHPGRGSPPRRRGATAGGRRHERRDRARDQGAGCSPPPARRAPPSRARRSRAGNARRPAPSSGCASTATARSPGSRSWAATFGPTMPASTRACRPPASPASAAPGSSRWWPSCSSPGVIDADGTIDGGAGRPHRPDRRRRPRRSPTCCTRRRLTARAAHHAERRPRHPAGQGGAASRHPAADGPCRSRPRWPTSGRCGWRGRSAATSTRCTPSFSG